MASQRPPYVELRKGAWYWAPRGRHRRAPDPADPGRLLTVSTPEPLGRDRTAAWSRGWQLYQAAAGFLEDLDGGRLTGALATDVAGGIRRWQKSDDYRLKADGSDKARRTIATQDINCRVLLEELGTGELRTIQRRHAKAFYAELREKRGRSMAASVCRTARQLWAHLLDEGEVEANPFRKLKLSVPKRLDLEFWGWRRVWRFHRRAAHMGRRSVGLAVLLCYDTAMNPSDVLALTPADYDGRAITKARGKTGRASRWPLSPEIRAELDESLRLARAGGAEPLHLVVSETTGRPCSYRNLAKWVRLVARAAHLPDELKLENLRKEAQQEAKDGNASPTAIQALAAHATTGTQDFYARALDATEAQEARWRVRAAKERKE